MPRIGVLTPSSNTVIEPITCAMVADLGAGVTAHFARVPVTHIDLGDTALRQFATADMVAAAELLADARVESIAWNGTSAGWLGLAADVELCERITEVTGRPAVTSTLAIHALLGRDGAARIALVSPYADDVQARVVETFESAGFAVVAERHLGLTDNYSFSEVGAGTIAEMVREVSLERPDAIVPFCTNLNVAPLVAALEAELDISIYDSLATAVWAAAAAIGLDTTRLARWGRALAVRTPVHQSGS